MHAASKILGANGQPYRNGHAPNGHAPATRQDLLDLIARTYDDRARKRRAQAAGGDIQAKYDAAAFKKRKQACSERVTGFC